ncbi:uncharacterized protein BDZ99DRAFT_466393, partial [Mytilinidion resinicola]
MSTCVGSKPNVEPMPRQDLKQHSACSLCLGDSILIAVKWRTLNSVVLAAIDNT